MLREICLAFDERESFLREYNRSIAHGSIFIGSCREFDLGEALELTIDLTFCQRRARILGVVTSRITSNLASATSRRSGVVIEFADRLDDLQDLVDETIGTERPPATRSGPVRSVRRAPRIEAVLAGELEIGEQRVAAHTKNLSRSGVLLEVTGMALEVGRSVSLSLVDPRSGELVAMPAKVVRQERNDGGQTSGVALEFSEDLDDAAARRTSLLDNVRASALARSLGGVSGRLAGLSLPNLLQGLATSSERGTLEVASEGAEGRVCFQSGALCYVQVGRVKGVKGLARLLQWSEGEFSFQPTIEEPIPSGFSIPVGPAILEAVHQRDELSRLDGKKVHDSLIVQRSAGAPGSVNETEAAVLELAEYPTGVAPILDVLPDSDAHIHRALLSLLDRDLLQIRD